VSAELSSALVSLARSGSPQSKRLPAWPRYSLERRETMIFDATTRLALDPRGVERALFQTVPFIQWGS
jgi:para-nitrobenzyl esterase